MYTVAFERDRARPAQKVSSPLLYVQSNRQHLIEVGVEAAGLEETSGFRAGTQGGGHQNHVTPTGVGPFTEGAIGQALPVPALLSALPHAPIAPVTLHLHEYVP